MNEVLFEKCHRYMNRRPVVISELIRVTRERMRLVNDEDTLNEMLTFVRNPDNPAKAEAEPGAHDDCIMSLSIAHYIRPQQSMEAPERPAEEKCRARWSDDMWEDYRHASGEERLRLIEEWGQPK